MKGSGKTVNGLKDKIVLVTGGSRGIGKTVARSLLGQGAVVWITARTEEELFSTERELAKAGTVHARPLDVSIEEDVNNWIREIIDRSGRIDVLVNGAGIQGEIGPFYRSDPVRWKETVSVNLFGTVHTSRSVLPHMIRRKKGKIINFSGGGATAPRPNFTAYGISKAAVVRFTEILAEEVKEYNIQVNAVAPGGVNTRMLEEVLEAGEKTAGPEYREALERREGGGTPPELTAELVSWLASDDSDWLTGRLISAPWDPWKQWREGKKISLSGSIYTLRRVDGKKIKEEQ